MEATLYEILQACPFKKGDTFYYRPRNGARSTKMTFDCIDHNNGRLSHHGGYLSCKDTMIYWENETQNVDVIPKSFDIGTKPKKESKQMDKSIVKAFPETASAVLVEKHFKGSIEALPEPFRSLLVTQYAKELYEQADAIEKSDLSQKANGCSTK